MLSCLIIREEDFDKNKTIHPLPLLPIYFEPKNGLAKAKTGWMFHLSKILFYLYLSRALFITIRTLPVIYQSFSNTILSMIYVVGLLVPSLFHYMTLIHCQEIAFLLSDFYQFSKGILRNNSRSLGGLRRILNMARLTLPSQVTFLILTFALGWSLPDDIRFTNSFIVKVSGIRQWYLLIPGTLYDTIISWVAYQAALLLTVILILFYYSSSQILQSLRNADPNLETIRTYRQLQIFQNHFAKFFGSSILYCRYGSVSVVIAGNAILVGRDTPTGMRGIAILTLVTGFVLLGYLFPLFSIMNTKSTSLLRFWKVYAKALTNNSKSLMLQKIVESLQPIDVKAGNLSTFRQRGMLRQISNVFYNSFRLVISRKK